MKLISLGVRDFALPCPLQGSIDSQSGFGPLPITGVEVHNTFLNKRKRSTPGYELEVKLARRFSVDDYEIRVSGRVDGVIERNDGDEVSHTLEEVKSDFDIFRLAQILKTNPDHPYCLQLKTYGYFFEKEHEKKCDLKLLLVSIKDGTTQTVPVQLGMDEYELWLHKRLRKIVEQYENSIERQNNRKKIATKIDFPFSKLRKGQKELIDSVERTVGNDSSSIIQAPTGLGKTMGVLYPSLKSNLSFGGKVVYVTAKNSQHQAVVDAQEKINKKNPLDKLRTLVLRAKSKVCLKDEVLCNSDYCEYAKDYYRKIGEGTAIKSALEKDLLTGEDFIELGKKYQVCPFELSLDMIEYSDLVVGDYNYVFSPRNIAGRFRPPFKEKTQKPVLLVDEAHNLPERAKSYFTSQINESELLELKKRIQKELPAYSIKAQALISDLLEVMRNYTNGGRYSVKQIEVKKEDFEKLKEKVSEFSNDYMAQTRNFLRQDPILRLNSIVSEFTESLDSKGTEFVQLIKPESGGTIKTSCLDASKKIKEAYNNFSSTVLFSATLKPFEYYKKVLGVCDVELDEKEFDSPFPSENRKLLVVPQVSTKYADRPKNYSKISQAIKRITAMKQGNYVVFFPSFQFLEEVLSITRLDSAAIIAQRRNMTNQEVDGYLEKLKEPNSSIVLFAVQGGIFSEGINYAGEMLIGTIIVGPGLPKFDLETQLLQSYFEEKHGEGYKYAFVYPAMTKVIQSAGRVIRAENELGLLVLLGRRFVTPEYKKAMPDYWLKSGINSLVSNSILNDVEAFWSSHS